ncbi:MAG TPA: L,D-transpeptidase, partial [Xanthomonadales bacterium]|nr:L,D-transpeptidase [Xanthomonadales bacterium]
DKTTPLGKYQVRRFNHESRFHLFIGVDYPNEEQAYAAYMADQITARDLELIFQAHQRGEEPPQNTYLGGAIGIHGIGNGDLAIHEEFNWTDGCVALTDAQIDEVALWVKIGTVVVIR